MAKVSQITERMSFLKVSVTNSYKHTWWDMSSGFVHKHKLLQNPTDNCERGISWENNNKKQFFASILRIEIQSYCTQKDKNLTEKKNQTSMNCFMVWE